MGPPNAWGPILRKKITFGSYIMEEKKLYNAVRKYITLADGREIMIETGKLAKQADGSVVVKMGGTMLLATVVAAKDAKPEIGRAHV